MSFTQKTLLMMALSILCSACDPQAEHQGAVDTSGFDAEVLMDAAARPDATVEDAAPDATPDAEAPPIELDWVALPAGEFMMGTDDELSQYEAFSHPAHLVTLPAFEIMRTEVTVDQYLACQAAGACAPMVEQQQWFGCNLTHADRGDHPVNCLRRDDAIAFATWAGARLPTEAEWEYAARSAGQDVRWPWGNETEPCLVDCSAYCSYAVMTMPGDPEEGTADTSCQEGSTLPVCSKPAGNTQQGLCDVAGNVAEWIADEFCGYDETPRDGSAAHCDSARRSMTRGGPSWYTAERVTVTARAGWLIDDSLSYSEDMGFRLARSAQSSPQ